MHGAVNFPLSKSIQMISFRIPRFTLYNRSACALLIFALFNVVIGQFTPIDLKIQDYYFNALTHQFPWHNNWFADDFMHSYLKKCIVFSGKLLILFVLIDALFKFNAIHHLTRVRLRFIGFASLIIPFIVSAIKNTSALHCPWDVTRYGGYAPFVKLFDHLPDNVKAGHCFPAGHATVGLWLAAICVFWLPHKPKMAFIVFLVGLSFGFAMGWVQQMRGAHFLFHSLWSTWIAAFIILMMLSFTEKLSSQAIK